MSVEDLVFGAMEGDLNCLEWFGYPLPPLPPEPPEGLLKCVSCRQYLPASAFYRDVRKLSGVESSCRRCKNRKRGMRQRKSAHSRAVRR